MAIIYVLKMLYTADETGTKYYKVGHLNSGDAASRMDYYNRDGSNVPLKHCFKLLDTWQYETPRAKAIEDLVHDKIRYEWKWECSGGKGMHFKHKYFPGKMVSGLTECRMYNVEELKEVYKFIKEELKKDKQ